MQEILFFGPDEKKVNRSRLDWRAVNKKKSSFIAFIEESAEHIQKSS